MKCIGHHSVVMRCLVVSCVASRPVASLECEFDYSVRNPVSSTSHEEDRDFGVIAVL